MSATEPLYVLLDTSYKLSKEELFILEAELFLCVCEKLMEIFKDQHMNYFRLLKFTVEKENAMLEVNFVRLIIRDILSTEEYTLEGIARYTDTHEDIIKEVFSGRNTSPSAKLLRRIIDLHRSIRRDLYNTIIKKIAIEHLGEN